MERAITILRDRIDSLYSFRGNFEEWVEHTNMLLTRLFGENHRSIRQLQAIIQDLDLQYSLKSIASDLYMRDEYEELTERITQLLNICIQELEIAEATRVNDGEANRVDVNRLSNTILERIPECDPVIIEFIIEASKCVYHANALLAATFMLGAASEKAILLLIEKYTESIQDERNRERFRNRVNNRMISVKYDEFVRSFAGCQNRPTDPVLSQDLDTIIGTTFQFCRITRNQIGHPEIVPEPDRDVVIANLGHFAVYIERIYGLIRYFDTNGVIL